MTIENRGTKNQYTATSGQTEFAYNFEVFESADLAVYQNTTLLAEGSDYTVSGVGLEKGGSITLAVATSGGEIMTLFRNTEPERLTEFTNSGKFLGQEVNTDIDRIWAFIQQIITDQERSIKLSQLSTTSGPINISDPVPGQALVYSDDGLSIESEPVESGPTAIGNLVPWYIKSTENLVIPSYKEMAVHGTFVADGILTIDENARLRIEP